MPVARQTLTAFPGLVREWHPTKNKSLRLTELTPHSRRPVWWKCPNGPDHEWQANPGDATQRKTVCPFCAGRKRVSATSSFAALRPDIAREWHPTKNGNLTAREVRPGSRRRVWWKCKAGQDHEWQAPLNQRTSRKATGCPFCANRRASQTNSLARHFPKISREWHPTKNGTLRPPQVVASSHKQVWWRCPTGHAYQASPAARTQRIADCPRCHGRRLTSQSSLAALRPTVAAEWHRTKNGHATPSKSHVRSKQLVWWSVRTVRTTSGKIESSTAQHDTPVARSASASERP